MKTDPDRPRSKYARWIDRWTRPLAAREDDALRHWQERVLQTLLLASVVFGLFAYVPSVWLSIREERCFIAVFDTVIFICMVGVFARRDLPYRLRSASLVAASYLVGLTLLVVLGPFGAGPVWLFAAPVLAGLLMGLSGALTALGLNAATLASVGVLIRTGIGSWPLPAANPVGKWFVSSVNFMLLDTVVTISLAVLLHGLRVSLQHEKELRASVEGKHAELAAAHRHLARETRERQQAAEALQESETRLQAIFDAVQTGILIGDDETGTVTDANPSAAKMIGLARPAIVGEPLQRYLAAAADGTTTDGAESVLWTTDAAERPILLNVTTVTLNRRSRRVVSFLDISRLRAAEADRSRLEAQLAQNHKMEAVGTLAGGIAHDFNNILSAVIGFTELAIDEVGEASPLRDYLDQVFAGGRRARELVRQILAFSRRDERNLEPVVLRRLAEEALQLIRASLPATIAIERRLESDASVMADASQVHQVLMNLCTNAWHAMETQGGTLTLGLEPVDGVPPVAGSEALTPGDYLRLWVRDQGSGMPPEVVERIFEPFFTTKPSGEGTGMGMAVVHGIVRSHGGGIGVESSPGRGTTVSVYLPVHGEKTALQTNADRPLPEGNERVLVVDDETAVAESLRQSLERLGYRVTTAPNARQALEALGADGDGFDLMITDMAMPNMAGDRLVEIVRERHPDLPVILCTGHSHRLTPERSVALGAAALALKPLPRAELAPLVRRVLDDAARRRSISASTETIVKGNQSF